MTLLTPPAPSDPLRSYKGLGTESFSLESYKHLRGLRGFSDLCLRNSFSDRGLYSPPGIPRLSWGRGAFYPQKGRFWSLVFAPVFLTAFSLFHLQNYDNNHGTHRRRAGPLPSPQITAGIHLH